MKEMKEKSHSIATVSESHSHDLKRRQRRLLRGNLGTHHTSTSVRALLRYLAPQALTLWNSVSSQDGVAEARQPRVRNDASLHECASKRFYCRAAYGILPKPSSCNLAQSRKDSTRCRRRSCRRSEVFPFTPISPCKPGTS